MAHRSTPYPCDAGSTFWLTGLTTNPCSDGWILRTFPTPQFPTEAQPMASFEFQVTYGFTLFWTDARHVGRQQAKMHCLGYQDNQNVSQRGIQFVNEHGTESGLHADWNLWWCATDATLLLTVFEFHCLGAYGVDAYGGKTVTLEGQWVSSFNGYNFDAEGEYAGIITARVYCNN